MGCCQDREVKITQDRAQIGMQRRKVRRQILKREIDTESMKNQDTMIVQDHFEIISEGTEPDLDEKALKNLLENYRQNKQ